MASQSSQNGNTLVEDVDRHIIKIKEALKSDNFCDDKSIEESLQLCLSSTSCTSLEDKIFGKICQPMLETVIDKIKDIDYMVKNNKYDGFINLQKKLKCCEYLLNLWRICIEHMKTYNHVKAEDINSFPMNFLRTVMCIINHYKDRMSIYGMYIDNLTLELANLFQKANVILNLFLVTLGDPILFDADAVLECNLLSDVMENVGNIVFALNGTDTKKFSESARGFERLAIRFRRELKRTRSTCITAYIERMSKEACLAVSKFTEPGNTIEKNYIKCWNTQLKVIDCISAIYKKRLQLQTLNSLVELITKLHKCSSTCIKKLGYDGKLIHEIDQLIAFGAELILEKIFTCNEFKKVYFEYEKNVNRDKIGYFLLTVNIVKILCTMPHEECNEWILSSNCILNSLFKMIDILQDEICCGQLRLPVACGIGESYRKASIYEIALISMSSLVSRVRPSEFASVERLLLKYLFSGNFLSSLLSSDLWCFVCRFGSVKLLFDHIAYLMRCYAGLEKRTDSLEVVMLSTLIRRLYMFLPDGEKVSIVEELSDIDKVVLWLPLAEVLTPRAKSVLCSRLSYDQQELTRSLDTLLEHPHLKNWTRLINAVTATKLLTNADEKDRIVALMPIWKLIHNSVEDCEGTILDTVGEFIRILLYATPPVQESDELYHAILKIILTSHIYLPSSAKLYISYYLKMNVNSFGGCSEKVADVIAELNSSLLSDENILVRQEALECFDFMAHNCPNEDLVTKMAAEIAKKPQVVSLVQAYLSQQVYAEEGKKPETKVDIRGLIKSMEEMYLSHRCYIREDSERDEKMVKIDKQSQPNSQSSSELSSENKVSDDIEKRVERVYEELHTLSLERSNISNASLRKLRKAFDLIFSQ